MPDVDSVLEQLYSDAAVREDLRDDEAETLLHWAEGQVERLAAEAPDDATFEAQAEQLRALLKDVNYVVGARETLDEPAMQASMNRLTADAQALGAQPVFSSQSATDLKAMDDATALQTVLASLNFDATAQAAPTTSPTDTDADEATMPPAAALPPMPAAPALPAGSTDPSAPAPPDVTTEAPDTRVRLDPGWTPLILWPRRPAGDRDSHDETPDTEEDDEEE